MSSPQLKLICIGILLLVVGTNSLAQEKPKTLVLQEMSWLDVENQTIS